MKIQEALDLIDELVYADNLNENQREMLNHLRDAVERQRITY